MSELGARLRHHNNLQCKYHDRALDKPGHGYVGELLNKLVDNIVCAKTPTISASSDLDLLVDPEDTSSASSADPPLVVTSSAAHTAKFYIQSDFDSVSATGNMKKKKSKKQSHADSPKTQKNEETVTDDRQNVFAESSQSQTEEVFSGLSPHLKQDCSHLKSINHVAVKKALKKRKQPIGVCEGCERHLNKSTSRKARASPEAEAETEEENTAIWICLRCGVQGCGRGTTHQHALKHYENTEHSVVVNIDTKMVWCYACDDEVPMDTSSHLKECVNQLSAFVRDHSTTTVKMPSHQEVSAPTTNVKKVVATTPTGVSGSVKGLQNLGNTCFFNSVMQCIAHCHQLRYALTSLTTSLEIKGARLQVFDDVGGWVISH